MFYIKKKGLNTAGVTGAENPLPRSPLAFGSSMQGLVLGGYLKSGDTQMRQLRFGVMSRDMSSS